MKPDITALIILIITVVLSIGISLAAKRLLKKGIKKWKGIPSPPPQKFHINQSDRPTRPRRAESLSSPKKPVSLEEKYAEAQTLEASALREIHQAQILRSSGRIAEYYEAISKSIKKYISEKYGVKNVDASTSRILESLPQELTAGVVDHVGEILRICDMASLKRHRPSRSELDHIFAITKEFIENNIVRPEGQQSDEIKKDDQEEADKLFRRYMR